MFVLAGLSASAGEFDLSDKVEAIRREGWRNVGFLAASPEPGRVCCTGMLTAAVLCLLIDAGFGGDWMTIALKILNPERAGLASVRVCAGTRLVWPGSD